MTNVVDMTIEEFSQSLREINDRVINFKLYEEFGKDKRKNPRNTRVYTNSKRGNFHGKSRWLTLNPSIDHMYSSKESIVKQTVSGLRELNNTVDTGKPRQNQMRIER